MRCTRGKGSAHLPCGPPAGVQTSFAQTSARSIGQSASVVHDGTQTLAAPMGTQAQPLASGGHLPVQSPLVPHAIASGGMGGGMPPSAPAAGGGGDIAAEPGLALGVALGLA